MLDDHPLNELGKGILAADVEAKLLARGIVFACRETAYPTRGKPIVFLITSKRPFAEIVNQRTASVPTRARRASRPVVNS